VKKATKRDGTSDDALSEPSLDDEGKWLEDMWEEHRLEKLG